MLRVALTGGIASGKTTVSDLFAALRVPVIDADLLAREAVAAGSQGLERVRQRFGDDVIDSSGELDRTAMRDIVFSDPQARADLEAIVHPQVRKLTDARLESIAASGASYCLIVIPLLVETGQLDRYQRIVVVDVSEQTQLERLLKRDHSNEQQARKIIASQASREQRLAVADHVIDNSATDLKLLKAQVARLHEQLLQDADSLNQD